MSIGTARPTEEETRRVQHYFVGTHSIIERFSAGQFELEALRLIEELRSSQHLAILTGGSMLYMDALTQGIDAFPVPDMALRATLTEQLNTEGVGTLFERLQTLDPVTAQRIDRCNGARVLRALEVTLQTGRPYSSWLEQQKHSRPFSLVSVGIRRSPEELNERIRRRVDTMVEEGLVAEVEALLPYHMLPALQTVGYLELFDYFDGKCTLTEAIELIKVHTRQYARRQMQWWKRNHAIRWFDAEDYQGLFTFVERSVAALATNTQQERGGKTE
jgi:tRNA dimethylallyltransferase